MSHAGWQLINPHSNKGGKVLMEVTQLKVGVCRSIIVQWKVLQGPGCAFPKLGPKRHLQEHALIPNLDWKLKAHLKGFC